MKQITPTCGFKDSKGKFWDTKEEAEDANFSYEQDELLSKLQALLWPEYYEPLRNMPRSRRIAYSKSTLHNAAMFLLSEPLILKAYINSHKELSINHNQKEKEWWKFW